MAGKRVYITIPQRDYLLLRHYAAMGAECPAVWIRRQLLTALYHILQDDPDLQDYDRELAAIERAAVIDGRYR